MNIGFFIPSLMGGGEEKRVRDISQFLARHGHKVHVFCERPDQPELAGVRVVQLRASGPLRLVRNAFALRRELRAQDIELMLCFKRAGSVMGFLLEHLGSKAQIFGNIANAWPGKLYLNRITPRRMISIHEDLNGQFMGRVRIQTIPIGVALPSLAQAAGRAPRAASGGGICQLLYVGGLSVQKRPERLLQLAAELQGRTFPFHLSILGQGPLEAELKASATEMGLTPAITFAGHTSPTEYYLACDFLLLTSDYEGLPNVILEAGALGTCVIATAVGAIGSVLADGRGRAFTGFDASVFADEIIKLYETSECVALGQNLQTYVKTHHDQADMLQGYLALAERNGPHARASKLAC